MPQYAATDSTSATSPGAGAGTTAAARRSGAVAVGAAPDARSSPPPRPGRAASISAPPLRPSSEASAVDDFGLFGRGSVSWRVHAEPILALAGLRALYLQSLHPRAMWGVAQNSRFREDPYGRLYRTGTYIATVVYGTTTEAHEAGRRLRAIHSRMRATDGRTGETFRVDDPELLRWVHVTEVESFVTTIRRAGTPLSDADVDRYYTEQLAAAELVGLDPATVPRSAAEVADYYDEIRPALGMTKEAAESALFLSAPPMPYKLGLTPVRLVWLGIASTAFGLLPSWARRLYGLPGLPTTGPTATLSARTLRLALRVLPERALHGPIYTNAMRRAAEAGWPPA